jgi:hypothetical protein
MEETLRIVGLSDADLQTLEREFEEADLKTALTVEKSNIPVGSRGVLEPLTAAVILSSAALSVLAIWVCRERRRETVIERRSGEDSLVIRTTEGSNCKSEVLAQLWKFFPGLKT